MGKSAKSKLSTPAKKREVKPRLRLSPDLPAPAENAEFAWAKRREELKGLDEGEFTATIMQMPAWDETVGAWCDDLDAKPGKRGERRWYTARELEAVALYQRVAGLTSCRAARDRLASDRGGKARKALGFDVPRERRHRKRSLLDGVPSEATLHRHRMRFKEDDRLREYQRFSERLSRRLTHGNLPCRR
jgi:hypothetical protein